MRGQTKAIFAHVQNIKMSTLLSLGITLGMSKLSIIAINSICHLSFIIIVFKLKITLMNTHLIGMFPKMYIPIPTYYIFINKCYLLFVLFYVGIFIKYNQ